MVARGILPTYVSDKKVVLCKAAPQIRNTYEIRLALFMSIQAGKSFVLAVRPSTRVEAALELHVRKHGGSIASATFNDYSVYVGALDRDGGELDGWVAGDNQAWDSVLAGISDPWLRGQLAVGVTTSGSELSRLVEVLRTQAIPGRNIDEEPFQQALLRLAIQAVESSGTIFVQ